MGTFETHITFRIKADSANPNWQAYFADETERAIQRIQGQPSPGIKYTRDGSLFAVDMIAYGREAHLDFYDRAFTRFSHDAAFGFIEPLPNQLTTAPSMPDQMRRSLPPS